MRSGPEQGPGSPDSETDGERLGAAYREPRERAGFLRSGLNAIATSWISVGLSFATSIVIARSLGPANKGAYDLTNATGNLAVLLLGLSLQSGTSYVVARGFVKPGALVKPLALWAVAQGAITAFAVLALTSTPFAGALMPTSLGLGLIPPLAAFVALTSLTNYLRGVLMGQRRIIAANTADLAGRIFVPIAVAASLGALFLFKGSPGVLLFLWCNVAGLAVAAMRFTLHLRAELRETDGPKRPAEIVSFALPAFAGNLVQFLNYRLDLFLVNAFLGIGAVGLYALAVSVAQLTWLLPQAAAAVLLPHVAADVDGTAGNAARSARVARLTFLVSAVGTAIMAIGGPTLVPFVYGTAFIGSLEPFLWLLPGVAGYSLYTILAAHIAGTGRPRLTFAIASVAFAVTLILDLALIPRIGIRGAAMASSASYLTSMVLGSIAFIRLTGLSPRLLFIPQRDDLLLIRTVADELVHRTRRKPAPR